MRQRAYINLNILRKYYEVLSIYYEIYIHNTYTGRTAGGALLFVTVVLLYLISTYPPVLVLLRTCTYILRSTLSYNTTV